MSAHFQPGSTSADLVMHREIEERIRWAREREMARTAPRRPAGRLALIELKPSRLLSTIRVTLLVPMTGQVRQALGGR